ncbi:MAG: helix-turn-helix domain-containing protein [Oscillospiraceae bacterium]|nr:helix-turn-helix domain-containing protein [Oscillospiraceae bacterium]
MNAINERIKLIRKDNNLTQKQFAKRILVTQSYLSRLESGKEIPNEKLIKLIALEFNVPTGWLENGVGSKTIVKGVNDYFDRGYNNTQQKEMQEQLEDFAMYLKKQNNEVISSYTSVIILEMKSFLESISNEPKGLQTATFEIIAAAVMELFIQLQKLSTDTKPESFNSIAWLCTSTLTESLAELREIYFNPDLFRYPDEDE